MCHGALDGHGFEWPLMFAPIEVEAAHHEFLALKGMHHSNRHQPVIVRIGQAAK
jgi:hypothetical protein